MAPLTAFQDTITWPLPGVAITSVGAPGSAAPLQVSVGLAMPLGVKPLLVVKASLSISAPSSRTLIFRVCLPAGMLMAVAFSFTQPQVFTGVGSVSCWSALPSTLIHMVSEPVSGPLASAQMKKLPVVATFRSYHSTLPSSGTVVWLPLPFVFSM